MLEEIFNVELWIWGCNFGFPAFMNDLNILDISSLVKDILDGKVLPNFIYNVNAKDRWLYYYFVDVLYPKWAIFVDIIPEVVSKTERHFFSAQEALRMDVESSFGVLLSHWHIHEKSCLFWDRFIMIKVMKVATLLHNMIFEHRRSEYDSGLFQEVYKAVERGYFIDSNGEQRPSVCNSCRNPYVALKMPLSDLEWSARLAVLEECITDEVDHYGLKYDLVRPVWWNWGLK